MRHWRENPRGSFGEIDLLGGMIPFTYTYTLLVISLRPAVMARQNLKPTSCELKGVSGLNLFPNFSFCFGLVPKKFMNCFEECKPLCFVIQKQDIMKDVLNCKFVEIKLIILHW